MAAHRGQLLRRIDSWDDGTRRAFAEWCSAGGGACAAEARDAGFETEAAALEAGASPYEVEVAAQAAVDAARSAAAVHLTGAGNVQRLASYTVDAVKWTS